MFENRDQDNEANNIRHIFDPSSGVLYLSIVDVIEMLGVSTDPRNYWKTLKSRLKNSSNKLVTKCNQLKMRASDGKMYLTDATDADSMLMLIQQVAPSRVGEFRKIFAQIEAKSSSSPTLPPTAESGLSTPRLTGSTVDTDEYELSVDAYEDKDVFVIEAMLAGVEPDNISVIATCKNILIKGERKQKNTSSDYITEELSWGKFSREIECPEEIDIEEIETAFKYGMLQIRLPKIDKTKTKIIKIKN